MLKESAEAARGVLKNKLFLRFSQYSQEYSQYSYSLYFCEIVFTVSTHLLIVKRFLLKVYSLFFVLFSSSIIITRTIVMVFCDYYISDTVKLKLIFWK